MIPYCLSNKSKLFGKATKTLHKIWSDFPSLPFLFLCLLCPKHTTLSAVLKHLAFHNSLLSRSLKCHKFHGTLSYFSPQMITQMSLPSALPSSPLPFLLCTLPSKPLHFLIISKIILYFYPHSKFLPAWEFWNSNLRHHSNIWVNAYYMQSTDSIYDTQFPVGILNAAEF